MFLPCFFLSDDFLLHAVALDAFTFSSCFLSLTSEIILRYVCVSNHLIVHLKLT